MITRNGVFGLTLACVLMGAAFLLVPSTASAGDKGLTVAPAIYRVREEGAKGPNVQLVRRWYYYGPYGYAPGWGYGYGVYRPIAPPVVVAPPPVVAPPVVNYGYPAYGYGYAPYTYGYGYGYPPPAVGFYGPRVAVGVGVW